MAGITVLDARLGFGRSAHIHRRHVFESDRAVVIEIVDEEERLRIFVQGLSDIPEIGLMTLEPVEVLAGSRAKPLLRRENERDARVCGTCRRTRECPTVRASLNATDRKSTRLNSSHSCASRMPSSA